jgi:prepilin-type N-terminal cleavage/methylation domain-containing protein/prepilin-type processing-associated H-X9-DG protein
MEELVLMHKRLVRGFTLIELLVVIAIIAILAAILFPVFAKAKEQSKISGCQSNLRQIHTALMAYVDDNDGRFPCSGELNLAGTKSSLTAPVPPYQMPSILKNYSGKNKQLWKCPADQLVPRVWNNSDPNWSRCDFAVFGSSYQWRMFYTPDPINGKTYSEVVAMSQVVRNKRSGPSQFSIARDAVPFHKNQNDATVKNWNEGGQASNVLFLDGHVKLTHGTAFTDGW